MERLTGRRWLEFVVSVQDQEVQPQQQEIQQEDGWMDGRTDEQQSDRKQLFSRETEVMFAAGEE